MQTAAGLSGGFLLQINFLLFRTQKNLSLTDELYLIIDNQAEKLCFTGAETLFCRHRNFVLQT